MARLIYSAIMSLDGYIADADGRFEWAAPDEGVFGFVNELERPVGTYLSGRRMYETMRYWETAHTVGRPVARRARLREDLAGGRQDRVFHHPPDAGYRQDPHRAGLRSGPGPQAEGSGPAVTSPSAARGSPPRPSRPGWWTNTSCSSSRPSWAAAPAPCRTRSA